MRVLVTGGAGFIGGHIAEALLNDPRVETVRICDNLSTGNIRNIEPLLAKHAGRLEFRNGDLLNDGLRFAAMAGIDTVFHQAAIPSVPRSVRLPLENHMNGGHLTLLVLESARAAGVDRVIYAGSSSAYGDNPLTPKNEAMATQALSPYAASKLSGEHYVESFAKCFDMDTATLRYFNVFGPRQDAASTYSGVLAKFCVSFRDGTPITIFGDGEQSRDFTYIDNIVGANLLAAFSERRLGGEAFNIGTGVPHTLNEVIDILKDMTGKNIEPTYAAERSGDIRHSLANISKATEILDYTPRVGFKEGLAATYGWYAK